MVALQNMQFLNFVKKQQKTAKIRDWIGVDKVS